MSIFEEPKIDCHVHVLDPARFPYQANTHYAPMGQEIGTPAQLEQVMNAYGTRHALRGEPFGWSGGHGLRRYVQPLQFAAGGLGVGGAARKRGAPRVERGGVALMVIPPEIAVRQGGLLNLVVP